MKTINIDLGKRSYDIYISSEPIEKIENSLLNFIKGCKTFIISDSNVDLLYTEKVISGLKNNSVYSGKFVFPAGEESKTLSTVEKCYHSMIKSSMDRSSIIIALGGGVVGDLGGFVASTYMRGIKYIQIPTTLLAMVDSSVGGKTAIDLDEGKNLIGAFWQPSGVLIYLEALNTLPERQIRCGLAEVIKYAMINDELFFKFLEENAKQIKQKEYSVYENIIKKCCSIKADIVSKDEREDSLRAILNFGHTFGHAIEKVSSYSTYQHGEAIAIGMLMACELGRLTNHCTREIKEKLQRLLHIFGLPERVEKLNTMAIYKAMSGDKKIKNGKLNFIVPDKKIGSVKIINDMDTELILKAIGACV